MPPRTYDVKIDSEPYVFDFDTDGIVLGDAVTEPAPNSQLGSAIIENVADGISTKVARGNGYYDINRLIPTVEGQLIFPPKVSVGAEFSLSGSFTYTPGIFHHTTSAGQYIAFGTRIYRLNLTDFAGLTYTLVASSDCTAAPISNANARYTGGAFVWRDRIYFGIENALNGGAIGYAYVDFVADDDLAFIASDDVRGFSYAASSRGRVFLAQNRATPEPARLRWASRMDVEYSALNTTTELHGYSTGEFLYAVEGRPRITWVMMLGGAALFFRADGSVLTSDEAGFMGIATPASQSSGALDNTQGFGSVHYIDGAAFRVFAGGPHHLNPVNLVVRSLSPGIVQDITTEVQDPDIYGMAAVGEHLFMGGQDYLYDCIWRDRPVVHKIVDLSALCANTNYVTGAMTQQGGILAITMHNSSTNRFQQLHLEVLPSIRKSTEVFSGSAQGWIEPGILTGPERSTNMTKLWLQVRSPYYTRVNASNTITFTNELVDEATSVDIATVNAAGPFAAAITAASHISRLGRTLSFRMNMNVVGATGYNEKVYFPLVVDFLWVPSDADYITLTLLATAEQEGRAGGLFNRANARATVDALRAKSRTVVTLEFSDSPDGAAPASWTMFVEQVEATRKMTGATNVGNYTYSVKMLMRRLA